MLAILNTKPYLHIIAIDDLPAEEWSGVNT